MSGMEEFLDLYIQTARERIQELNNLLLKLEQNPEQLNIVEELMRSGHSLKGESAAMGYESLATLAHVIEDLFTGIGKGELKISDQLMDELFKALDQIGQSVDAIEKEGKELDCSSATNAIKALTGLKTEGFGKTDKSQAVVSTPAPTETTAPEVTPVPAENAAAKEPEAGPSPAETKPAATNGESKSAGKQISSVTMKIDKLDQMISVSEELVLLKMKLKTNSLVQSDSNLKAHIHRLDRLVTDMQFHIMQARLFPISLAFQTLPRLTRDTTKKTGRKVRLEMAGEDTTVDRTIIDHLTEPFVHMIRNAIDHGIEDPADRVKTGKNEEALIKISAYTKENRFYVEIEDDGRGIEWEKLAKKAVAKGMITQEEVDSWTSDEDRQKVLFLGGVSVNDVVTDVSGRGVGLSAVKEAIKKLGGSVLVKTQVGKGTKFTLRLPMTLAIMQALLIKIDHQVYAMPANEIIRSIQISTDQIQSSGNRHAIVVDQQQVPLYYLKNMFDLGSQARAASTGEARPAVIVLVRRENTVIGCVVDKIIAEEEILVKPLGPLLKHSVYFSGATILADGSAAPIINFEGL